MMVRDHFEVIGSDVNGKKKGVFVSFNPSIPNDIKYKVLYNRIVSFHMTLPHDPSTHFDFGLNFDLPGSGFSVSKVP